jgi:hypothetical protein
MRDDTAAALSLIKTVPKNWRSVDVSRNENGSYSVLVTTRRGAKHATLLPDYSSVQEFGSLLKNREAQGRTATERRNLKTQWVKANGTPYEISIKMSLGYDTQSMAPSPSDAKIKPVMGKAIPRKRD